MSSTVASIHFFTKAVLCFLMSLAFIGITFIRMITPFNGTLVSSDCFEKSSFYCMLLFCCRFWNIETSSKLTLLECFCCALVLCAPFENTILQLLLVHMEVCSGSSVALTLHSFRVQLWWTVSRHCLELLLGGIVFHVLCCRSGD